MKSEKGHFSIEAALVKEALGISIKFLVSWKDLVMLIHDLLEYMYGLLN